MQVGLRVGREGGGPRCGFQDEQDVDRRGWGPTQRLRSEESLSQWVRTTQLSIRLI